MDSKQELREKVLSYVKNIYDKEQRSPTIREISEKIEGITRSNIYRYFKGIGQICEEAGIDKPNSRLSHTRKASLARKKKSESGFPDIRFSGKLAQDLWVASNLERKDPEDLIEELLEEYRLFKTQYDLDSNSIGNFAKLIKECESVGLGRDQIKKTMLKFTEMGLQGLSPNRFDMLMKICNFMIENILDIPHLLVAFAQKEDLYKNGYDLCTGYAEDEVLRLLTEKGKMRPVDAVSLALDLKLELLTRRPTRLPREPTADYRFEPGF